MFDWVTKGVRLSITAMEEGHAQSKKGGKIDRLATPRHSRRNREIATDCNSGNLRGGVSRNGSVESAPPATPGFDQSRQRRSESLRGVICAPGVPGCHGPAGKHPGF